MHDELKHGTGLQPLPENPGCRSDILASKVLGVMGASELPTADFDVATPLKIKNQGGLDFCTGFCASEVTEDQEGEEMDPIFQFAAGKRIVGEFKNWGCDLRSIGMGLVTYGSLPAKLAPFQVWAVEGRDFLANWANYSQKLWDAALAHKKLTMIFVDGPNDLFDNIRSAMWLNRATKRSVMLGVTWRKSWTRSQGGVIPEWTKLEAADNAGGHCIKGFGQKTIGGQVYLKIQNSWGDEVGDHGIYYFPRSVVNKEFGPYGQITFKDMDPEDAHKINDDKGAPVEDQPEPSFVVKLIRSIIDALQKLLTSIGVIQ